MDAKAALLARMHDVAQRMRRLDGWLAEEVAAVQAEGTDVVPQLAYLDLANGAVSASGYACGGAAASSFVTYSMRHKQFGR